MRKSSGMLSGREVMVDELDWRDYLAAYHDAHSGITERLFERLDSSPYAWLAGLLEGRPGPVLDLACGSAPLREELGNRSRSGIGSYGVNWLGVDSSAGELAEAVRRGRGPLVRGSADALPVASGAVGGVAASMCLPVVTPLDTVLAEVRRVLRPGGVLAALVPARASLALSGLLGWARVLSALRAVQQPWPNPEARDRVSVRLQGAGFVMRVDERRVFALRLETPEDAACLVDALYLPGLTTQRTEAAKDRLARWTRPGRILPLPLRRVLAEVAEASDEPPGPTSRGKKGTGT